MARYRYKAAARSGEVIEGEREAPNQAEVVRFLQAQGHVPILAEEMVAGTPKQRRRWRPGGRAAEVGGFTAQLASLLSAGLALDQALGMVASLARDAVFHETVNDLQAQVRRGVDLSVAMGRHPRIFSRVYRSMVQAGEASGALGPALFRLAEAHEQARDLREALITALTYPAVLLGFAVLSLGVILGVVIPRLSALFAGAGRELPAATQVVVFVGAAVHDWWWAIVALICAAWLGARWHLRRPRARASWHRRLLTLPLAGGVIAKYEAGRFSRTLGTLLQGGVPLLEGIEIARGAVGNRAVESGLGRVAASVRQGQGFAGPLRNAGVFPDLAVDLLRIGEETGNLEDMLLRVANIYDRETRASIKRAGDILGPLLILILATLIGAIVMSVLIAVLGVNELAF